MNDYAFMAEAVRLAKKGLYIVRVNPRVGCVIVKDGRIISRGYHASLGQNHAEIDALENTTENAENSTVYVTLEPCSHEGRTPPCVKSLVEVGVMRVVVAAQDPNPQVNGRGLAYLSQHGVQVQCDVLKEEAMELNKGFFLRMQKGRPHVTVKVAVSLDGKTALANGISKWISGEPARLDVQKLRARSCAIMSGIGTVLADDPIFTVRIAKEQLDLESEPQQPLRVILDTNLMMPETAKVLHGPGKTVIYTCSTDPQKIERLRSKNVEITVMEQDSLDLAEVLLDLATREINEVLVEAGSRLTGSLLSQGLVDEMVVYMAPHIIGESGQGLARLPLITDMRNRLAMQIEDISVIGEDIKLRFRPSGT